MNKNRLLITDWIDKLSAISNSHDPSHQSCSSEQEVSSRPFYEYFHDDSTSYHPDLYSFSSHLELTEAGLVSGSGTVTRRRTWVWPTFSGWTSWEAVSGGQVGLHSLTGQITENLLSGEVRLRFCNDLTFLLRIKSGSLHGLCLASFQDHLVWAGRYQEGLLTRSISLDWESGALLSDQEIYLYPDMLTALTGVWDRGRMVSAREAEVETLRLGDDDLPLIVCSPPTGPEYSFSPSGPDNFGPSDPQLCEPYERKYIRVGRSGIEDSGEGVFALTDLQPGSLAAVFNGYKVPLCSGGDPTAGLSSLEEVYERLAYNIHMPEDENFYIDFPPSMASLTVYRASLGHKVNHSFLPNSVFGTMFHPRWGRVRTVVTTSLVRAGEEILVDYGYDLVRCPDWYRNMWTDTIGAKTGLNYLEYRK